MGDLVQYDKPKAGCIVMLVMLLCYSYLHSIDVHFFGPLEMFLGAGNRRVQGEKEKETWGKTCPDGPDGFFWSSFPASVPLRKSERKKMWLPRRRESARPKCAKPPWVASPFVNKMQIVVFLVSRIGGMLALYTYTFDLLCDIRTKSCTAVGIVSSSPFLVLSLCLCRLGWTSTKARQCLVRSQPQVPRKWRCGDLYLHPMLRTWQRCRSTVHGQLRQKQSTKWCWTARHPENASVFCCFLLLSCDPT